MMHSSELTQSFQTLLTKRLEGIDPKRVVVVGVGKRMRGDDAVGLVLLDTLRDVLFHLVDAGNTPEEYLSIIKRLDPHVIIFLDALDRGLPPGTICLVEKDDIQPRYESSHNLSLDILLEYLACETGADVFVVGIQYGTISFGSGLSPEVEESVLICARVIYNAQ
jgi:hydrogenase maturation protease